VSSGLAIATPSVLVIDRSTCGVNGSLSVALLLPGIGSVTPGGVPTVAVLVIVPSAAAATVAATVYVTLAPTGRLTVSLIDPLPDAAQLAPPVAEQVHVGDVNDAGMVSTTVAATTAEGPAFEAVIV
jgi:hypothetical protein